MSKGILRTPLCDFLGIEHPVILAGMGGVSRAELVAAVSNAGGLGIIGAATMGADELRAEIRKVRELTDKPFGVDLLLPGGVVPPTPSGAPARTTDWRSLLPQDHVQVVNKLRQKFELPVVQRPMPRGGLLTPDFTRRQVDVILEERVPVFASGLGNPAPYVQELHAIGTKVIALVGNVKNARRVAEGGTDIIVAQGHEAGGHTGRIGTLALVPQVVDAVHPKMVVAAGGVADGRGLAAALALGAVGVWVGTAFVATKEAHLDDVRKRRILAAAEEDTRITRLYSGKTMRNINNPLIEAWEQEGIAALPMGLQGALISDLLYAAEQAGRRDLLPNPAGQVSGMLREIRPAGEVLEEIVQGAARILETILPSYLAVLSQ